MMNNSAIASAEDGIMTVVHTVNKPTFEEGIETYCMVAYPVIQNDEHSDKIYFSSSPGASAAFSLTYHETSVDGNVKYDDTRYYLVHSATSSATCSPLYKYATAYCADCDSYSGASYLSYNNEATFKSTGYTMGTVIKKSYTSACTWTFSATSGKSCFYTIAYNGLWEEDTQKITSSAKEYKYTLDGVTFYVQITTSSIKLKASTIVTADNFSTMFAFYVRT